MKAHSTTGFLVRDLACLKVTEATMPKRTPILREHTDSSRKSPPITATEPGLKAYPDLAKLITALNKMIVTASFTTPSPSTTAKSLGCFLALMIATAAITSVEHIRAHMTSTSESRSVTGCSTHFPVSFTKTFYVISKFHTNARVTPVYAKKANSVPMTPKSMILEKFSKNFLRYMLKPAANTIGGRTK